MALGTAAVEAHARALGCSGHRLARLLRAAEARSGRTIGLRVGRRWLVSEADLRRYCPELYGGAVESLSDIERATRDHLRAIDARIDGRAEAVAVRVVAAEREAREAGDLRVAGLVREVAASVGRLGGRLARVESQVGRQALDGVADDGRPGQAERR